MGNLDNLNSSVQSPGTSQLQVVGASKSYRNARRSRGSRVRDPFIIPRVNQYLAENKDQVYFDINDMVDALRKRYREYRRRSWGQFKVLVERAFAVVSKNSGMDIDMQLSRSSSSDIEECNASDDGQNLNSSNAQMMNLYQSPQVDSVGSRVDKNGGNSTELINLSSDDEPRNEGRQNHIHSAATVVTPRSHSSATGHREAKNSQSATRLPDVTISRIPEQKNTFRLNKRKRNLEEPKVTFNDFAGNAAVLEEVCKLILHMRHPEVFRKMGVSAPRGFLLHGPPGSGKTLLANAIAGELRIPLIKVAGPELVAGVSGESEERVRDLFATALATAPCVLFIDEVDAVSPHRQNAKREMERRIVAQLLTSLDDLGSKENGDQVLVIGATNLPDSLDPALRRAGRFDREVCLGIPDVSAREQILRVLCKNLALASEVNFSLLAQLTPGFVGADMLSLIREAAMIAIARVFDDIQNCEKSRPKKRRGSSNDYGVSSKRRNPAGKADDVSQIEDSDQQCDVINGDNSVTLEEKNTDDKKDDDILDIVGDESRKQGCDSEMDVVGTDVDEEQTPKESIIGPPSLVSLLSWLRSTHSLTSAQLQQFLITPADFTAALKSVQPSAKREGFATVPDVTWNDIGSLSSIREHLKMTILGPMKYKEQFETLGLVAPAGVLLCGPPGCGKTLLAKAVANEAGINFISVKGPELLNMYVGESERAVRQVFQRARNSAPCVIFFDELDALCPRRIDGDASSTMRVVNQMLTEMDGVGERRGVFLMAASNRPDIIDPAVLRPGRLDKTVYVGLPNAVDRTDILRALTKNKTKPPISADVCLNTLASREQLEHFTGADLAALVREASMEAVRQVIAAGSNEPSVNLEVNLGHFEAALRIIRPSITPQDRKRYEDMKIQFASVTSV